MKLHHVAIVGRDPEVLARRMIRSGATIVTPLIRDPNQRVQVQFFRDRAGMLFETVCPLTSAEDSPLASRLSRGGGIDHICYELEKEDGAMEIVISSAVEHGAKLVCAPVYAEAFNRRIAFVIQPSGLLLELVETRISANLV